MIISTTVIAAASLMSPADVAQDISSLNLNESESNALTQTVGEDLENKVKMGASTNFTYSFQGPGPQVMDDARQWD